MKVTSPIATGGGGDHFEQHVAAFMLGLLLVRGTPPILIDTSVVEVHLQTAHMDWQTDDVLIVGETSNRNRRKLAVQVKRTFTVSAKNEDCRMTMQRMWDDFVAVGRFSSAMDHLAIVTLHGTSTLLRDFNSLLLCARAAVDAEDLCRRLSFDGYVSKKAKEQNHLVREIVENHAGSPVSEDMFWRFLRTVNVLSFDLNTPTAQNEAGILSLLSLSVIESTDPLGVAKDTWARLLECVGLGRPMAKSFEKNDLPPDLLDRHSAVSTADSQALQALVEHGNTIRNNIRSTIGHSYTLDRSPHVLEVLDQLAEHQIVIVTGTAGSGKSALAKEVAVQLDDYPTLTFEAVEFAEAHIDATLGKAQTTLSAHRLFALLSGQARMLIWIESVERLLEHPVRDAFSQLLQLALRGHSIKLVLTVRDYSLQTVRDSLLIPIGLPHVVFGVPALSDDELDQVGTALPNLKPPLRNGQLRSLLRTPYLLDMASRLDWTGGTLPVNAREFREKCWIELIRADAFPAGGMPHRREQVFLDVAYRRATELRPYVQPGVTDAEAFNVLQQDSLIEHSPDSTSLFAVAHDVLEDWAILRWLENQFVVGEGSVSGLVQAVGGYPAIRRGFRRWLDERFETDPEAACQFVLLVLGQGEVPSYFRDDCLVSVLLSDRARDFLEGCRGRISEGDSELLSQIVHILRVACKESPRWLDIPALPSMMLVPAGPGWAPTLRLVSDMIQDLLPQHAELVLGLVEDWAKQISWRNPAPKGFREAGALVDLLLSEFDGYLGDTGNRILEVLLKIPKAVPQFQQLVERARTSDPDDHMARDFVHLLLKGLSAGFVCRDFPSEVISVLNARLKMAEHDVSIRSASSFRGSHDVSAAFGLRNTGMSGFWPPSALQGPFLALLQSHPHDALTFIVELLNHAGDWYGNQRWPGGRGLEQAWRITLDIPGYGSVQQWMSGRLYGLHRGRAGGPFVLESALMALEWWLLEIGKSEDADLEAWLLDILRRSNNAMLTSVVASICVAYPERAGRAGLALLSNREVIQFDLERSASEDIVPLNLISGLGPTNFPYKQEREESNNLEHRRKHLEFLAIQMQTFNDTRESVWRILDRHYSEIPTDQNEEIRIWRLALHRMDVRRYKQLSPEEHKKDASIDGENWVYMGPREIEPDIQEMIDKNAKEQAELNRHLRLQNEATNAWRDDASTGATNWSALLAEARRIEQEHGEPDFYCRRGPGLTAAVCVRDHLDELDDDDLRWCIRRIDLEVRRDSKAVDHMVILSKRQNDPDRAGASVVPLLAIHPEIPDEFNPMALLSLVLTHPVVEVRNSANFGVGAFLGDEHRELILLCAAATAYWARLSNESTDQEIGVAGEVRRAIEDGDLDVAVELMTLDFDAPSSYEAVPNVLSMLGGHPEWEESRQFYERVTRWVAGAHDLGSRGYYALKHDVLSSIASFGLKLPVEEARRICNPLLKAVSDHPDDTAELLHQLIVSADGQSDDCFWELWQDIADLAVGAPWIWQLQNGRPHSVPLIDRIFLNVRWKDDAKHWNRLDGHAHRLDAVAQELPLTIYSSSAYTTFLYTIGQRSLPDSFKVLGSMFQTGEAIRMATASAFSLETLLRRFVYFEPYRLKTDPDLREAVLVILDALVAGGSSSAYRMRDDFVTPLGRTVTRES